MSSPSSSAMPPARARDHRYSALSLLGWLAACQAAVVLGSLFTVPLRAPVTLLRHHFRRHPHPAVAGQTYLEPHPAELLRDGC